MSVKIKTVNEYQITTDTMVILPHLDQYGYLHSYVIEVFRIIIVKQPPMKVVEESCGYHGSSYKGRVEGTCKVTGYTKIVPIIISAPLDIILFPLESANNLTCVWLAHSHVKGIRAVDSNQAMVILSGGKPLTVDSTREMVETKRNRAAQYRTMIRDRSKLYSYNHFDGVEEIDQSLLKNLYLDDNNTYQINQDVDGDRPFC
jgi:competence protein ComK